MKCSKEIEAAIFERKPIVALESTIISHGMPFPENVATARALEKVVYEQGAIPATVAIIKGEIKVGLESEELEYLGRAGQKVIKASRRDIPFIVSGKLDGATTVAATMIIAAMADIRIFATGGIGGVHRGAEDTMDVSADLQELARTNVAVVSAGIKSILDIQLTLEYLETQGVPVVGYQTNDFPAFYTRKSGFEVDYRMDNPKEMAEVLKCKWDLGLDGGVIIGNPIPEAYSYDEKEINIAINLALDEARRKNITGKEITPFLLSKISQITQGKSLESNIALAKNNAKLAAQIAVELAGLSH